VEEIQPDDLANAVITLDSATEVVTPLPMPVAAPKRRGRPPKAKEAPVASVLSVEAPKAPPELAAITALVEASSDKPNKRVSLKHVGHFDFYANSDSEAIAMFKLKTSAKSSDYPFEVTDIN
jgi:hypothetical protein